METSTIIPRRADGLSKISCTNAKIRTVDATNISCDSLSCNSILRNVYQVNDNNPITIGIMSSSQTLISKINVPADVKNTLCMIICTVQLGGDDTSRAVNIELEGVAESKRVFNFCDADTARTDYNIISTTVITTPTTNTLSLVGYCNTYEVNKTDVFWKIIPLFGATTVALTLV